MIISGTQLRDTTTNLEHDEQHRLWRLTSRRQSIRPQRFGVKQVSRDDNIWNTVERTGEPGGTKYTTYTCWIYCSTHRTIGCLFYILHKRIDCS